MAGTTFSTDGTSEHRAPTDGPRSKQYVQVAVPVVVMVPLTVFVGYGGGLVLTLVARPGGPDPITDDGERLRQRLLARPERNREFMRTDGRAEFPWPP